MNTEEECKARFQTLLEGYQGITQPKKDSLWEEVKNRYTESHRSYHNLNHLYQMLKEYDLVFPKWKDPEVALFALFYHDLIYDVTSKTNEEESAKIAEKRLSELAITQNRIGICVGHILATKSHRLGENCHPDTSYFLDIDISILGSEESKYIEYAKNIRKEYSIYSDEDYKKGRTQVLNHFIENVRLFHTDSFFDRYEMQSRHNIKNEIHSLQKGKLI
ncbi:HD domain-containing protein [Leptospira brenneri]|uniref:HD domain-containing protein n=1 Tax=Leptospira brenneri TaxID=2023182 RepID=UPI000C2A7F2D|nr:hypothetical protein [Leptospira brenneri]PJZ46641.1 hypothetical protein CH361_06105 [Leptospira brenneri]